MSCEDFKNFKNLESAWFALLKTGIVSEKHEDWKIADVWLYLEEKKKEIKFNYCQKGRAFESSLNQVPNGTVANEASNFNGLNSNRTNTSYTNSQETKTATHTPSYSEIKELIPIQIQSFLGGDLTKKFQSSFEKIRNNIAFQNISWQDASQNVICLVDCRSNPQSKAWEADDYIKKMKFQNYVVVLFYDLQSPIKMEESTFWPFNEEFRISYDFSLAFNQQFGANGPVSLLRDCVSRLKKK